MNIILKSRAPGPSLTYILVVSAYILCSVIFAGYLYFHYGKLLYPVIAGGISCLFLLLMTSTFPPGPAPVLINDEGILDRRLGVGIIRWEDIVDAQIEVNGLFLCLRLKNPEVYIERLGPVKKKNMQFHQSLGFRMLNIEVRGLDVSLISLLDLVRKQIGQKTK